MTKMEIVSITPEHAKWLLEHKNPHNRRVREKDVHTYSRDMANGHWRNTGEAIKFDEDGNLLDGQHRLHAIAHSGVTIDLLVITGDLDQEQMDSGVKRTMADVLKLRGEQNYIVLATVLRSICRWDTENQNYMNQAPSRSEMFALLEEYPWVRQITPMVHSLQVEADVSTTVGALAMFWFWQIDPTDTVEFAKRVRMGNGEENDPAFRLHRWFASEALRKTTGERAQLAVVVKAWNAYRDGAPVQSLRYRASQYRPEAFPIPH
jgi:hypothetical protein